MAYTGASPTYQSFPIDYFSGDGVTTSFDLSYPASAEGSILVTVNNQHVYSNKYTVNNRSLVFSNYTPPAGTNNIEVLYLGLPALSEAVTGVTSVGLLSNLQGITVGNSPVITSGVMTLNGTLSVGSGGTGGTNYGQSQLMVGNGTSPFTSLGSTGATNQALISNGTGVNPSWQNVVNSFSVGTTGLTAGNTGSITLGGILNVSTGGTGVVSLVNNRVLLGNGTNPVAQVNSAGTVGQVLTSTGNNPPTWQTLPVLSVTAPPTLGLTLTNTAGAVVMGGTLAVTNGGTGSTSVVPNSVVIGNSTGATYTTVSNTGLAGQVLTSNGAAAPTWQNSLPINAWSANNAVPINGLIFGTVQRDNGSGPAAFTCVPNTVYSADTTGVNPNIRIIISGSGATYAQTGTYRCIGGSSVDNNALFIRVT